VLQTHEKIRQAPTGYADTFKPKAIAEGHRIIDQTHPPLPQKLFLSAKNYTYAAQTISLLFHSNTPTIREHFAQLFFQR
jgi:hypothetical protein